MNRSSTADNGGFSLVELVVAMTVTLTVLAITTKMLGRTWGVRNRENQRTEAIADVQRALNGMTREIANSGFGMTTNGIVPLDSNATSIRIRANLDAFDGVANSSDRIAGAGEDVKFTMDIDANENYLVRYDPNNPVANKQITVLANRIDSISILYYGEKVSYNVNTGTCGVTITTPGISEIADKSQATYIIIVVCVRLPQIGTPGGEGYQPATSVKLASDVELRNQNPGSF